MWKLLVNLASKRDVWKPRIFLEEKRISFRMFLKKERQDVHPTNTWSIDRSNFVLLSNFIYDIKSFISPSLGFNFQQWKFVSGKLKPKKCSYYFFATLSSLRKAAFACSCPSETYRKFFQWEDAKADAPGVVWLARWDSANFLEVPTILRSKPSPKLLPALKEYMIQVRIRF